MSEDARKMILKEYEVLHPSTPAYPGTKPGKQWTTKDYEKSLKIKIVRKEDMEMEFDLIGVDPSLANAFRRILISEVPTMAIEKVHCYNNTSIIQVKGYFPSFITSIVNVVLRIYRTRFSPTGWDCSRSAPTPASSSGSPQRPTTPAPKRTPWSSS